MILSSGDFVPGWRCGHVWRHSDCHVSHGGVKARDAGQHPTVTLQEFPLWLNRLSTQLCLWRMQVGSQASLTGFRIQYCHELWCRSQMGLDQIRASGTPICHTCSCILKKRKKERQMHSGRTGQPPPMCKYQWCKGGKQWAKLCLPDPFSPVPSP